jgi:hypothetical protein
MNIEKKARAILAVLQCRSFAVQNDSITSEPERHRLCAEITELKKRAICGGVPREDWENHELNWMGYCANLRHNLVRNLAQSLIASETKSKRNDVGSERQTPELTRKMRRILYWWEAEGGKEQLLSQLPIEERRLLEVSRQY